MAAATPRCLTASSLLQFKVCGRLISERARLIFRLYTLPIGRGKLLGGGMPDWLDRLAGGWELGSLGFLTSGSPMTNVSLRDLVRTAYGLTYNTIAGGPACSRWDVEPGVAMPLRILRGIWRSGGCGKFLTTASGFCFSNGRRRGQLLARTFH